MLLNHGASTIRVAREVLKLPLDALASDALRYRTEGYSIR
jgi:hypothetical protein